MLQHWFGAVAMAMASALTAGDLAPLLGAHDQLLLRVQPVDALRIHFPTFPPQQHGQAPIAITHVAGRHLAQAPPQHGIEPPHFLLVHPGRPTDLHQPGRSPLDLQALHRVRDRLVSRRTSIINQIRAFLLERGITFRQGRLYLRKNMPAILEDAEITLSPRMRDLVHELWQEWLSAEAQIDHATGEIERIAKHDAGCRRLLDVPGVGSLVATAMVAAVGDGLAFAKGREFGASMGLVPRQYSTGGKSKLLGISKRGNQYLRRLFIHGARSVMMHVDRQQRPL